MGKRKTKFTAISVSSALADEIEKIIEENPELGYLSIAEFVRDAIRERILEIRKERKKD